MKVFFQTLGVLIFSILAAFLIFWGCFYNFTWHDKPNFKIGQMFTHKYGYGSVTFTVKDFNKNGVVVTAQDWSYNENMFISYTSLRIDPLFFKLKSFDSRAIPKKLINNGIKKLKKDDVFVIKWGIGGTDLYTFKVVSSNEYGVFANRLNWLNNKEHFISYIDINRLESFRLLR